MSFKSSNGSFSKIVEGQSEERDCLLHIYTDVTKEIVSVEEIERLERREEELRRQGKDDEGTEKQPIEAEGPIGREEEAVMLEELKKTKEMKDLGIEKFDHAERKGTFKREDERTVAVRDKSKLKDATEFERFAALAEPEESENEGDSQNTKQELDRVILHENVDSEACEKCLKILEENAEQLTKLSYSEKMWNLEDLSFEETNLFDETPALKENGESSKLPHNIDQDSCGSFRASVRSLSTCHDSLPSSRGCPSKRDLHLDLECRICHDAEGQDLISPCHCAGTSKWVHESCIIRWIRHTKTKQCEICTCPITVKRKKKPIDQWTRPSATCGPCNKLDIWYCFVLALCILIIIGFLVLQSHYDVTEQTETTVIFASIYVLCGMIIMMKVRYFWAWFVHRSSFWGNWKNLNEEWRIVEANEANAQSPVSPV